MRSRVLAALRRDPAVIPAFVGVAAIVVASLSGIAYEPRRWYPLTIFLFLLLAVSLASLPRAAAPRRSAVVAGAALIAFGAWSLLSILWADDRGEAWQGADRTLLYVAAFLLFALWPLRARAAALVLGTWTLWVIALGVVTQLRIHNVVDTDSLFDLERLYQPAGYVNAEAAVFLMGVPAALALASRRETPWWTRGIFAGGVVVLVDTALMAQSRGATIALPIVIALYFIFVPGRVRSIVTAVPIAVGIGLTASRALDVADRILAGAPERDAVAGVPGAILTAAAIVAGVVTLLAIVDRRVKLRQVTLRRAHRGISAVAFAAVAAGLVVALVTIGNPVHRVNHLWDTFKKETYADITLDQSRLGQGLGGSRYDYYRVALDEFSAHPVIGIGADNYLQPYLRHRDSKADAPHYPHSVELRTLSQLGIVGAALLLAFLLAAGAAVWSGMRRGPTFGRVACGAAAGAFVYWFVHGSGDWFFEYAGLGAPAFAMLGLAVALAPRRAAGERAARPWLARPPAIAGAAVIAVALAVLLVPPWLSERWISYATNEWRTDPAAAYEHLGRAADANPLSDRPYLVGGVIGVGIGDLPRARTQFTQALERNDENSYTLLQLGAIASETGHRRQATSYLARARALNPLDEVTRDAARKVAKGRRVHAAAINKEILRLVRRLVK
jgi:O-antigen ligase